jgi:cysteine desulfurase
VAALDLEGVEASTGSACTTGSAEPSHVLLSMGIEPERAHGALRLTAGRGTTGDEIDESVRIIRTVVGRMRDGVPAASEVASA